MEAHGKGGGRGCGPFSRMIPDQRASSTPWRALFGRTIEYAHSTPSGARARFTGPCPRSHSESLVTQGFSDMALPPLYGPPPPYTDARKNDHRGGGKYGLDGVWKVMVIFYKN